MSEARNFADDYEVGSTLEHRVADRLGGVVLTDPRYRDLGDVLLPDQHLLVECKSDNAWDDFGNIAVEIADLEPSNKDAYLTGIVKHSAYGLPTIIVHGLGEKASRLLVYSPYWMLTALALTPPVRFQSWHNGNRSARNRTAGFIIPGPARPGRRLNDPRWYSLGSIPALPVIETTFDNLPDAVLDAARWPIPQAIPDGVGLYRRLAVNHADQDINKCVRRVAVKGKVDDSVHALLRGQQASVG